MTFRPHRSPSAACGLRAILCNSFGRVPDRRTGIGRQTNAAGGSTADQERAGKQVGPEREAPAPGRASGHQGRGPSPGAGGQRPSRRPAAYPRTKRWAEESRSVDFCRGYPSVFLMAAVDDVGAAPVRGAEPCSRRLLTGRQPAQRRPRATGPAEQWELIIRSPTKNMPPRPTAEDNSHRLSTANAARKLPPAPDVQPWIT